VTPADERRLQRFDAFARGVNDELSQTRAQMDELRAEGRVKSATYQQLMANRMVLEQIVARLKEFGL
jgi:hypothetical protein